MSGRTGRTALPPLPGVQVPTSLSDLLQILRRDPELPIWAGGTWWMDRGERCSRLVAIHGVSELKRVVRSDVQVDVGAAVPIARLKDVGEAFLPPVLIQAMDQLGPPPVRNLATLGGALCIPDGMLPIALVLQLLDARAEIRRHGRSRWSSVNKIEPAPGEVLTRIRIPLRTRTDWMLHTFGFPYPAGSSSLTSVATAIVEKSNLEDLQSGFLINGRQIMRVRQAEVEVIGRSLPMTERDLRTILGALENHPLFGTDLDDLGRWRALSTLRQFLRRLG